LPYEGIVFVECVNLELTKLDGTPVSGLQSLTLPADGQISKFIDELSYGLPCSFQEFLRVTSADPLALAELRGRYNRRGDGRASLQLEKDPLHRRTERVRPVGA